MHAERRAACKAGGGLVPDGMTWAGRKPGGGCMQACKHAERMPNASDNASMQTAPTLRWLPAL